MILRRLVDAIREQHWFTVVLEVLIVVVGIFVGLQMDDWNERRKERVMEREYLERLLTDAENSTDSIRATVRMLDGLIDQSMLVLGALQSGKLDGKDVAAFNIAVVDFAAMPPSQSDLTTIYELQSAGRLSIIRNVELRGLLGRLASHTSYIEKQVVYYRDMTNLLASETRRYWRTDFDLGFVTNLRADDSAVTGPIAAGNIPLDEFEEIIGEPDFRTSAARILENRLRIRRWHQQYLERSLAARDALYDELARSGGGTG
ncbi:MAG: hypothetical protein OEV34_08970 [Gammaproteobacteria bacterium]|nr:hypothetical protein [Gammaproteobacteria bacterium]